QRKATALSSGPAAFPAAHRTQAIRTLRKAHRGGTGERPLRAEKHKPPSPNDTKKNKAQRALSSLRARRGGPAASRQLRSARAARVVDALAVVVSAEPIVLPEPELLPVIVPLPLVLPLVVP